MLIDVQYFAILADSIGSSTDSLELHDGASVSDAIEMLAQRHEIIQTMQTSLAAAVENAYVPPSHPLKEGDTIAIIPPVSGG